jgi:N-acyl-L-homoserine lactone synthetase
MRDKTFEQVGAFRYKLFCETRNWKSGLDIYETDIQDTRARGKFLLAERDEFDASDETVYLISYDSRQKIDGIARLQSTEYPYMLQKDCFKNIPGFINEPLPCSASVWEATRTGFDPGLDKESQRRITGKIATSYFEFCLKNKIDFVIGTMSLIIIHILFGKSGCTIKGGAKDDMQYMGTPVNMQDAISGAIDKNAVAAKLRISTDAYIRVRATRGTSENILYTLMQDRPFPGIQRLSKIPHNIR